jgi:hypothetical protein
MNLADLAMGRVQPGGPGGFDERMGQRMMGQRQSMGPRFGNTGGASLLNDMGMDASPMKPNYQMGQSLGLMGNTGNAGLVGQPPQTGGVDPLYPGASPMPPRMMQPGGPGGFERMPAQRMPAQPMGNDQLMQTLMRMFRGG